MLCTHGASPPPACFSHHAVTFPSILHPAALGLSQKFVPHSLRHGGATELDLQGVSVEDIMKFGRWEASKNARRYIQSGKALMLAADVPPAVELLGGLYATDLAYYLSLSQKH
jgi:hypothetical protein